MYRGIYRTARLMNIMLLPSFLVMDAPGSRAA